MREAISGGATTETTLLILLALRTPRHGYAVGQAVEAMTEGRVKLGLGTLYGAIRTLCAKRWIEEVRREDNKVIYALTQEGRCRIEEEEQRLNQLLALIRL